MEEQYNKIVNHLKRNWGKYLVLLIYTILISIVIYKHEPWADEAQAWLLARDASYPDLLLKYVRDEGSPPLWHLILSIPAKLKFPYFSMSIISGLIAITGVYVFLFYSPFPDYIKILFPFSYFIFYQYGVVARSYVLLPLLLFSIAKTYKNKRENIFTFVILLALLANTNLFGFFIACSIMFIHFIDLIKERHFLDNIQIKKQIQAYTLFSIIIILIFIMIWPNKQVYNARTNFNYGVYNLLRYFYFSLNETVSIPLFITSTIWFFRRKSLLLYLMPTSILIVFFAVKYYVPWHQGILFLILTFVMWVTLEKEKKKRSRLSKITKINLLVLFILLIIQITWTVDTSIRDYYGPYSAGKNIADYIRENNLENKKIYALGYCSISVLPYFENNIYGNYHNGEKPSFWIWSGKNTNERHKIILKDQPDLIIIARPSYYNTNFPGYQFVGSFKGTIYWKRIIAETNYFSLFRKEEIS